MKSYTAQELTIWKFEELCKKANRDGFLNASDEAELKRCLFLLQHWGIEHPLVKTIKNQDEYKPSDEEILKTLRKI
jgi:HD-like signal output (HDOD) protein